MPAQAKQGSEGGVVKEILGAVAASDRLADALDPWEFAREGGWADRLADELVKQKQKERDKLKPTQLRKFFGRLLEIQAKASQASDPSSYRGEIAMMHAELAYAQARGLVPKEFREVLRACLCQEKIKDAEDLERLVDFMRAIIAYAKLYS